MNTESIRPWDKTLEVIGWAYLAALIIHKEIIVAVVGTLSFAVLLWQFVRDKKRSAKRIIAMILCVLPVILSAVSMAKTAAPYKYFGEICDDLFTEKTNYRVINDTEDMTEEFLAQHEKNYQNGNYEAIMDSLIDNKQMITWQEEKDTSEGERNVKAYFYLADRQDGYFPGNNFEFTASIEGSYTYDNISGEILDHGVAVINVNKDYVQSGGKCRINGISSGYVESTDKKTAIFTADFYLEVGEKGSMKSYGPYSMSAQSRAK